MVLRYKDVEYGICTLVMDCTLEDLDDRSAEFYFFNSSKGELVSQGYTHSREVLEFMHSNKYKIIDDSLSEDRYAKMLLAYKGV